MDKQGNALVDQMDAIAAGLITMGDSHRTALARSVSRAWVVGAMITQLDTDLIEMLDSSPQSEELMDEEASLGQLRLAVDRGVERLTADLEAEATPDRDAERRAALDELRAAEASTGNRVFVHGMPTSPEALRELAALVRGEDPAVISVEQPGPRFQWPIERPVPVALSRSLYRNLDGYAAASRRIRDLGGSASMRRARMLVRFFATYARRVEIRYRRRHILHDAHVRENATARELCVRARWHAERVGAG